MKTIQSILVFFLLSLSLAALAQSSYSSITSRRSMIYEDNFMTDSGDWSRALATDTRLNYRGNGALEIIHGAPGYGIITLTKNIGLGDNYDIEARIMPNDGGLNGILFGRSSGKYARFGIDNADDYLIVRDRDYKYDSSVDGWSVSSAINEAVYNKLTVRKYNGKFYFFINEELVYQTSEALDFGDGIGLVVSADDASMDVDYIRIYNYGNAPRTRGLAYDAVTNKRSKVYEDNFMTDSGDWSRSLSTDTRLNYRGNGALEIIHGAPGYGIITLTKNIGLSDNYDIEARIMPNDGGLNGILFGRDGGKYARFGIDNYDDYLIVRDRNYKYDSSVEGWSTCDDINEGVYNKLTVRKYNGTFYFYINEELVFQTDEQLDFGKGLGLVVSADDASMDVDYIRVYNLGGGSSPSPYKPRPNSDNKRYSSVKSSQKRLVYKDEFTSSTGDWNTSDLGTQTTFTVSGGYATLKHGAPGYGIATLRKNVSAGSDYEVEAAIKVKDAGLNGILFGRSGREYFRFGIGNDEEFLVVRDKNNRYDSSVAGWTGFSEYKSYGYNKITVRKLKGRFYFYVNEELVYETDEDLDHDNNFGLVVSSDDSYMEIDYFRIYKIGSKNTGGTGSTE